MTSIANPSKPQLVASIKFQMLLALSIAIAVSFGTRPLMGVAGLAYFSMILGLIHRKHKVTHRNFMLSAIILDIILVLGLELQRSAIKTAASFSLDLFQQLHIATSLVAMLLYFPLLYLGFQLLTATSAKRVQSLRKWHIPLGLTTFVFRTLGFFLMFSMLTIDKY